MELELILKVTSLAAVMVYGACITALSHKWIARFSLAVIVLSSSWLLAVDYGVIGIFVVGITFVLLPLLCSLIAYVIAWIVLRNTETINGNAGINLKLKAFDLYKSILFIEHNPPEGFTPKKCGDSIIKGKW